MSRAVILPLLLILFCGYYADSQTLSDEQRRRAERELQSATPSDIHDRLQAAGISHEEAIRRARAEGISLEKYLFPDRPDASDPAATEDPAGEALIPEEPVGEYSQNVRETRRKYLVGEFQNRNKADQLEAFGYNIFQFPVSTFEPVLNIPPPPNYRLGPGDEIVISVWGEVQLFHRLTINREGAIMVPDVGQISAAGLTLSEMRDRLKQRMARVYSSLDESRNNVRSYLEVSVGTLRTIQVFVLGDVKHPGGYTLSSMSTAFKALYFSGGPAINGTMRNIRVIRGNEEINVIDFYEYALKGDQSKDVRIEDGDIIFVPPVGRRVALAGSVVRPAIYEMQEGEALGDLITMAGGLRFNAYIDRIHIERIVPFAQRRDFRYNMLDIDVRFNDAEEIKLSDYVLQPGDVVTVLSREPRLENRVRIIGNVFKPGIYELTPEMSVSDLIRKADGLLDNTFTDRATLVRVREEDMKKEILRVDLRRADEGNPNHDLKLKRLDELYVYSQDYFFPEQTVTISGEVRNPGTYTRGHGMTAEDLIVMAGGATEEAILGEVTVSRIDTTSERMYSEVFHIGITENYWAIKDNPGGFLLSDFDHVKVPADPKKNKQRYIEVSGEVRFPGRYVLLNDEERLSSVIERAGGLKETAYPEGARFFRTIDGDRRLLPTSLSLALKDNSSGYNVILRDRDEIIIPDNPRVIIIRGSVNVPSAVKYEEGKSLRYYINRAGGYAENADKGNTTVILPNGQLWETSGWFFIPNDDILAGSIINVPEKAPRDRRNMEILRDWTTLMASTAAIIVGIVQITR